MRESSGAWWTTYPPRKDLDACGPLAHRVSPPHANMRPMSSEEPSSTGLTPGFMVVHGNHPETLRDLVRD